MIDHAAMSASDADLTADIEALLGLADILRDPDQKVGERNDYRRARIVLEKAARQLADSGASMPNLHRRVTLALARTWFDDPELHKWRATNEAWKLLSSEFELDHDQDPEVLGLAGRINRRRWELSGQSRDLRRATYLYHLGYDLERLPAEGDDDFVRLAERNALNGLQGAILLIELARLEERTLHSLKAKTHYEERVPPIDEMKSDPTTMDLVAAIEGITAHELRSTAAEMMTGACALMSDLARREGATWLHLAGLAALAFGLRRYDEARTAARRARELIDEAAEQPGGPNDLDVKRWANEFVLMAHQRGIRPEVAAYLQTEGQGTVAGQLTFGAVEKRARSALEFDIEGEATAAIAERLHFGSPEEARAAIIRAEQREVLDVITTLLGVDTDSLGVDFLAGKTGLALSGGGFRAAFYHAGVLAALADASVLPRIEVLSCVSGGSIAGMYYYLRLKELLECKRDADITIDDYRSIVGDLCEGLVRGAGKDLRSRIFANPLHNLRMLRRYSPSMRLGDLLQDHVLPEIMDRPGGGGLRANQAEAGRSVIDDRSTHSGPTPDEVVRVLSQLRIRPRTSAGDQPPQYEEDFSPRSDNWTRSNKVPILILNATSLNTGHNWQFTAAHMGEPPAMIHPEIDANPRLRRVPISSELPPSGRKQLGQSMRSMVSGRAASERAGQRYHEFRADLQRLLGDHWRPAVDAVLDDLDVKGLKAVEADALPLGHAVAASAAVPGIFEPVSLRAGYPPMLVKLSDGGVVDNQGISGLLEQDCDTLFVSDGSRQLAPATDPGGGMMPAFRSSTISKERIRATQYEELRTLRRSQHLRDFLFVHLNMDLDSVPIGWLGAVDPEPISTLGDDDGCTVYGIDRGIQQALARMRTDIDAFSRIEAWALMTSGYLMTLATRREGVGPFRYPADALKVASRRWPFLAMAPLMGRQVDPEQDTEFAKQQRKVRRHLGAARRSVFRFVVQRDPRRTQSNPKSTEEAEEAQRRRRRADTIGAALLTVVLAAVVGVAMSASGSYRVGFSVSQSMALGVLGLIVLGGILLLASGLPATPAAVAWRVILILFGGVVLLVVSWLSLLGTFLGRRRGRVPGIADHAGRYEWRSPCTPTE